MHVVSYTHVHVHVAKHCTDAQTHIHTHAACIIYTCVILYVCMYIHFVIVGIYMYVHMCVCMYYVSMCFVLVIHVSLLHLFMFSSELENVSNSSAHTTMQELLPVLYLH